MRPALDMENRLFTSARSFILRGICRNFELRGESTGSPPLSAQSAELQVIAKTVLIHRMREGFLDVHCQSLLPHQ